ncbi:hypothetical protein QF034_007923 [Streptomyces africanus]|uniref:Uncharacterized protein n=1 Tax=Streptomyces africanus TaxID=231024 RepID=A0ABU0R232_9ACTN|nr:hypothetical protein [Streptomyces africanus]MDQ0753692.1 hypothetical protein [Streptomyces africanus]
MTPYSPRTPSSWAAALSPEAFPARPFLDLLTAYGLVLGVREQ